MQPSYRRVPTVCVLAALTLVASTAAEQSRQAVPIRPDDSTIVHVLNRAGFGPRPGDVELVREQGLEAYIERQLHPARLADQGMAARTAHLQTTAMTARELAESYFGPAERARRRAQPAPGATQEMRAVEAGPEALAARRVIADIQQQKILRAAYSERQLEEVLVDFWFNHFNVFAGKGPTRLYVTEYERETIRPRALGRFRDLLGAVASSPAMLFYLDNWQSAAPRPQARGRGPADTAPTRSRRPSGVNENYARELLELHTLGVDGGYTQKDVQEVARAFTGWTIQGPRQGGGFAFNPRLHEEGEKVVLGKRIRAGGREDGEAVLDLLAAHPATARTIASKLARRFVSDDPPRALVDRAAERFRATGGDIREVVRLIVTSREFFAPEARRAKVKTPFEFVVSAVRAAGVDTANAMPFVQATRQLGMPLYLCQPPTGYADTAEAWVNTGALLNRMNFATRLTTGRVPGASGPTSVDAFTRNILGGGLTPATAGLVAKAAEPGQALALLLGSPEFQKR